MDRKQRESLVNLLDKHAWYVATSSDQFTNDEFEDAKREFIEAKEEFIGKPEPTRPKAKRLL